MKMVQCSITQYSHEALKKIQAHEEDKRKRKVSYNLIIHELLAQKLAEIDEENHDIGKLIKLD